LRAAVEPVYEQLNADPLTAELITEIATLTETVMVEPLAIPSGCSGPAPGREAVVAEGGDHPAVLNGSYHLEWMPDGIVEAIGIDDPEVRRLAENSAGTVVVTFIDSLPRARACPRERTDSLLQGDRRRLLRGAAPHC